MRFKKLDLNLLLALDVLLDEQNVTKSADRLNVSQPAMSAMLGRLRDYFGDPLLVQHGKRMIPTEHATRIRSRLKDTLRDMEGVVSEAIHFDPATSNRCFRVGVSDYGLAVIFTQLLPKLERFAPHITLDCVQPSDSLNVLLDQGELDFIITPLEVAVPGHPTEVIFKERFVVVGWSENPLIKKGKMSRNDFFQAEHIGVRIGWLNKKSVAENHLAKLERERSVTLQVSSFLSVPELLEGSMKLSVMHERLAKKYSTRAAMGLVPLPFKTPEVSVVLQCHSSRQNDSGLRWLFDQIQQVV